MKLVKSSAEIVTYTPDLLKVLERAGRVCYKSEDRIAPGTDATLVSKVIDNHHESVVEHGVITVQIICDRGVSHELVRHRLMSFSQESTRYCNYSSGRFGSELTFVDPRPAFGWGAESPQFTAWYDAMACAEHAYLELMSSGASAQEARAVLPNSTKTELVVTANARQWRHVFDLRCALAAHPQMREVMRPLRDEFRSLWPTLFY